MTKERMNKELLYQASLSPFKEMLKESVISEEDYRLINTILCKKYSPIFAKESYQISLDNKKQ